MTAPKYGGWSTPAPNGLSATLVPLDTKGPKRLWSAPAGYVTRHRGVATVKNTYVCPVHGAFEAQSDEASVACPLDDLHDAGAAEGCELVNCGYDPPLCGLDSPWSPSPFSVWASAGEVKS